MTIFDLLFLLTLLVVLVSLVAAAAALITGRQARALRIGRALAVGLALYAVTSVTVSLATPQRVIAAGEPWCFDDWCLTLERVTERDAGDQIEYTADLRVFSRARRVSQRANGAWIYLLDDQGRRYAPLPDPATVPLDVLLAPLESRTTSRQFKLPAGTRAIGLVTGHGGPYCGLGGLLIIGEAGCLFGKPTMVGIHAHA
jgi:hypothetical protein